VVLAEDTDVAVPVYTNVHPRRPVAAEAPANVPTEHTIQVLYTFLEQIHTVYSNHR
jgi:hypothetical protein